MNNIRRVIGSIGRSTINKSFTTSSWLLARTRNDIVRINRSHGTNSVNGLIVHKRSKAAEYMIEDNDDMENKKTYERGQQIDVKIIEFIQIGAIVSIDNNDAKGLISNLELEYFMKKNGLDNSNFRIGHVLVGYVNRIREDDKIDVGLRLPPLERNKATEKAIMDLLKKTDTGVIPIGDKSSAESIASLLPGISKSTFKLVVGNMYKENKVEPGSFETKLIFNPREKLPPRPIQQRHQQQQQQQHHHEGVIFLGNLSSTLSHSDGLKYLKDILKGIEISKFVIGRSKTDALPTCSGHLQLSNPLLLDTAMQVLKNSELLGRKLRVEAAKFMPKYKAGASHDIHSTTVSVFHRSLKKDYIQYQIDKIFPNKEVTKSLRFDKSGRFLHIDFTNKADADTFIYELNGKLYDGARFKVSNTVKISSLLTKEEQYSN